MLLIAFQFSVRLTGQFGFGIRARFSRTHNESRRFPEGKLDLYRESLE